MQQFDTLIVGQGIAGSLLAFHLHKQQRSFRVFDAGHNNSASRVAAGMFTPVSGKRKTISKEYFSQLELAMAVYQEMGALLRIKFLHRENVYHLFADEKEKQLLLQKAGLPEYKGIFSNAIDSSATTTGDREGINILHSGWVDCPLLITSFRQWLVTHNLLLDDLFDHDLLKTGTSLYTYKDLQFRNIVFCEGFRGAANPFFTEQIIPCKGDMINIKISGNVPSDIFKQKGFYMLPPNAGLSRVGATFRFHDDDELLREGDRRELEAAAASMLNENDFETISHQSAIRATTPGQQVIARAHPSGEHMFMLNGFGAKGVLLAPVSAALMAAQLSDTR